MKVVILAGGHGTRLGQLSDVIPKPMVRIGEKPIIWHIMKIYSHFGLNDFIVCLGVKGEVIKHYFNHYQHLNCDFTINLKSMIKEFHSSHEDAFNVTLAETGNTALKGARIKKIEQYLDDETNLLTYGDGLADIDINELLKFHKSHGKLLTISAVHPPERFGELKHKDGRVLSFIEKPKKSQRYINGGFMVFNKGFLKYLTTDDNCDFESGPLEELSKKDQIMAYQHEKNWDCMDHERDVIYLNELWNSNNAFWKTW